MVKIFIIFGDTCPAVCRGLSKPRSREDPGNEVACLQRNTLVVISAKTMCSKTIIRFGLIITGMRVSQTSSNNCYILLDDGADWLKSNSITMKTEDHGRKKKAQQPGGGIPLHNQSLRWNVLPRLPGPDPVYDMDF